MLLNAAVTLRDARPGDAERVVAWLEDEDLEVAFGVDETRVAVAAGEVVGAVRLQPLRDGTHELAGLVVAPAWRGHGVGARLVEDALARAPQRVVGLALAPDYFERFGFRVLEAVPAALADKAGGACHAATPIARDPPPSDEVAVRASKS